MAAHLHLALQAIRNCLGFTGFRRYIVSKEGRETGNRLLLGLLEVYGMARVDRSGVLRVFYSNSRGWPAYFLTHTWGMYYFLQISA